MDDIARSVRQAHHRRASDENADRAPVVVLHDAGYHVIGGQLVADALVRRIREGAKGFGFVDVCVEMRYRSAEKGEENERAGGAVTLVDCHSYPDGVALFDDPDALQSRIMSALDASTARRNRVVAIDGGVSSLMCRHGARRTARLVDAVRRHPSTYCVVMGCVHGDMHEAHEVSLLCHDPVAEVHVLAERRAVVKLATAKGCKITEQCTFEIGCGGSEMREGGVLSFRKEREGEVSGKPPPPPGLPSTTVKNAHRSEAERRAKSNVILPYERQGHAREYAADADFREYLPVEAGGWLQTQRRDGLAGGGDDDDDDDDALTRTTHRLGTIDYLRGDSDDESFDSDEDPDDEIDI